MNWSLLANSISVASASTLLALVLGLAVAVVLSASAPFMRRALLLMTIAVLALPSFLVTNCWIDWLGTNGLLHRWLPVNIFSHGGAIWILALLLWPIPALAIWSAWQKLEVVHFEIDPALRGWSLFRHLLFPAARASIVGSAAIIFALALNNFAVPSILQIKVFPSEIWVKFNTSLDAVAALQLSWPLLLAPLLLLLVLRRNEISWPRESATEIARCFRRQLGSGSRTLATVCAMVVFALSLLIPVAQLVATPRTWSEFVPAFIAGETALANSFVYAAGTTVIAVLLGLTLVRVRGLAWFWILFFLPGVLLGIGAVTAFNRPGLDWFSRTAGIVIFVLVMRYFALARSLTRTAHRSLDNDLIDSARLDGARGLQLFRRIIFPQIASPLAAAAYIIYVLCLWDVETVLLVIPPGGETLALRIFNLLHYGHNSHVNALCLLLLLLALAPLFVFALWRAIGWTNSNSGRERGDQREPQRGSTSQPSVATKELRWVDERSWFNPERVGALIEPRQTHKWIQPFQGWFISTSLPRVARASQPWAERWNPFRILFAFALLFFIGGCEQRAKERGNQTSLQSSIFGHVEIIGSRGTGAGQFNKPRSLALDANDNLFVVDMTGRVQKFSPDGKFLLSWQMPQTDLGKPKGMCRDRDGNIVILEPHYQRVNHFTPDGKLIAQWGVKGTNAGELTLPRAVAVDSKNNVIVPEYTLVDRVQKFSPYGKQCLATWGTPGLGTGQFNRAEGVGVDSADRIYIADSCNHRIQIFSSDGKFLRMYGKAGTGVGEMNYPSDIRVDEQGRQYVCEFGGNRIQVFDANDRPLEIVGRAGDAPGEFHEPWSIAFDSKGNLFVADALNHRVQKLIRNPKSKVQGPRSEMFGRLATLDFGHWTLDTSE